MIDLDLQGAPDLDDDDQREAWRIHSDREAAWAIRKLATALTEVQRLGQAAADEIDAIKAWRDAALTGPTRDASFFEMALVRYRLELEDRDPDLPKTYKIPGGTIARRKKPDTYRVTDPDAFTAWALDNDRQLLKVTPMVSGLHDRYHPAVDGTGPVTDANGEYVPGVEYVRGDDAYSAKPT